MSKTSEFIYLSYPGPGDVGAAPTVVEEAELAFGFIDDELKARGLSLANVVKVRLWYSGLQDFPDMNSVRDPLYRRTFANSSWPASSGFVTGGRGGPSPRFEIEVIAHPTQRGRSTEAAIRQWGDVTPPFSHANSTGSVVFLSGQGGYKADGSLSSPDPVIQSIEALKAVAGILAAEDLEVADVIGITVFTAPDATARLTAVEAEVAKFIAANGATDVPMVVTWLDVDELAFPGMNVEIDVFAIPGSSSSSRIVATRGEGTNATTVVSGESLVLGNSAAVGDSDSVMHDLIDAAAARLVESLDEVGLADEADSLVTIWYSPASERQAAVDAAAEIFPASSNVSVQPLPAHADAKSVLIEVVSSING
jgi:enamine deaminase RidA (YjgF/YER057c/UK114 family)